MSLPPTLWKSLATASSRFSGLASMPLTASDVESTTRDEDWHGSLLEYFAYLIERKSVRLRAGCHRVNNSAHVSRPPLGFELNDSLWLRRQLKNRGLLTLAQRCQEHDLAIRKLQRVVMSDDLFFVDLPKDRCLVLDRTVVPRPQSSWQALNLVSKSQLSSW